MILKFEVKSVGHLEYPTEVRRRLPEQIKLTVFEYNGGNEHEIHLHMPKHIARQIVELLNESK